MVCSTFPVGAIEKYDSSTELDANTAVHYTVEQALNHNEVHHRKGMNSSHSSPNGTMTKGEEDFSLRVQKAPIQDVIHTLTEMTGQNAIFAGTISGRITANLEHITPKEALHVVLLSKGLIAREEKGTIIIFDGTSEKEAGKGAQSFRLSYADATEVAKSLQALSPGDHIAANPAANTVIVSGTPLTLMQAASIISSMDRPEKQVKVEAEVIAVNRAYAKELGIDWNFKSLTGSAEYQRDSWKEPHYVTDGEGNTLFDTERNPRIRHMEREGWRVTIPEGYAGISYGRSVSGHPYTFFFQAKLNALVAQGKAKVLARPNVVTMNGRKAEILIGSQIPVIVEHMQDGVKSTATEYRDAGIKLTYTPRISENDDITADVRAEVSTPYLVPEMKAYRIITRQANTMIRLRSGDCITIGGLIDKEESRTFRKVPILGDIPLLGKLFQSTSTSVDESEVVIIIRADIIE